MSPQEERIKFARTWIDQITPSILKIFGSNCKVDLKDNKSEVTEPDKNTEKNFRADIGSLFQPME
jgi:fructose-1,6-bisphosphatase/inositol monophosphatase family enzyme